MFYGLKNHDLMDVEVGILYNLKNNHLQKQILYDYQEGQVRTKGANMQPNWAVVTRNIVVIQKVEAKTSSLQWF